MGCLFFILGMAAPRVAIFLLWFFSNWFGGVFHGLLIPLLGFIFLPYTLLWYSVVLNVFSGVWGFWQVAFLIVALVLDLGSTGGSAKRKRRGYA